MDGNTDFSLQERNVLLLTGQIRISSVELTMFVSVGCVFSSMREFSLLN